MSTTAQDAPSAPEGTLENTPAHGKAPGSPGFRLLAKAAFVLYAAAWVAVVVGDVAGLGLGSRDRRIGVAIAMLGVSFMLLSVVATGMRGAFSRGPSHPIPPLVRAVILAIGALLLVKGVRLLFP